MNILFSYEKFLQIFENDDIFPIDETMFYFDDDFEETEHYLGCIRKYNKPYWAGYCDFLDGYECATAIELLNAKIYNGQSIKEKWEHIIFVNIGGIPINDWLDYYNKLYY